MTHHSTGDHTPTTPLRFGAATASYQIEGATGEDGRGPSIWDTFTAQPGAVRDASDGSVACDSYHRWPEDVDLLTGLDVDLYRFSVSWSRILPTGTGAVESRGLDYYDKLVDALLERGIDPAVTLYHWDLPQPLEDAGGWLARPTAEAFATYAGIVHERLGDRVTLWTTHNEPWVAAYLGYAAGVHAPGRREGGEAHAAVHHLLLGHALASQTLRSRGVDQVGIVLNLVPVWPEPGAEEIAEEIDALKNRVWLGPLAHGAYDEGTLRVAPRLADADLVRPGDLDLIAGSADWIGVNYYTPVRPSAPIEGKEPHPETAAFPGARPFDLLVREPRTDIGWEIDAAGMEDVLTTTYERTGLPLMVTENGMAAPDTVRAADGSVADDDRIDYLRDHLAAVDVVRERGVDVRAYFVWTLLDNFEWAEGYAKTFGLVHIDPATQDRTPKASYHWYAEQVRARHAADRA